MDANINIDAYLNNPKLTKSDGFRILEMANNIKPADITPNILKNPHCIPIIQLAAPMEIAARILDIAIAERVLEKP